MNLNRIALFGEGIRGPFGAPQQANSLEELCDMLGPEPAPELLEIALRALHAGHGLIFFRVEEVGFSHRDYKKGLTYLASDPEVIGLAMPGLSDPELMALTLEICKAHHLLFFPMLPDLYDLWSASRKGAA